MDTEVFLEKERIFPGVHKIGAAISGPRIADNNLTDTRIFLILQDEQQQMQQLKKGNCNKQKQQKQEQPKQETTQTHNQHTHTQNHKQQVQKQRPHKIEGNM